MTEITEYKKLTHECGMSYEGAARVLDGAMKGMKVSHDTSRQWGCGSRGTPIRAIHKLTKLSKFIENEIKDK